MPARKRKVIAVAVRPRKPSLRTEIASLRTTVKDSLNQQEMLNELERRYLRVEKDYRALKDKVVGLLNPDQIEAARVCGCPPEIYCLEWIDIILKSDLKKYTPSFQESTKSLAEMRYGAI